MYDLNLTSEILINKMSIPILHVYRSIRKETSILQQQLMQPPDSYSLRGPGNPTLCQWHAKIVKHQCVKLAM
jgi:hypothetical protein